MGQLLAKPKLVGQVVGALLESQHFHLPAYRLLYREVVDSYYADEPIDALSIAERVSKPLSRVWNVEEPEAVARVQTIAASQRLQTRADHAVAHAKIVKRDSDYRALLDLSESVRASVAEESSAPDEIAGLTSQMAMQIATSTLLTHEILSFEELGRRFVSHQRELMNAHAAGVELGAYFGMAFLDQYLRGLRPGEVFIVSGEPGAGKSSVVWEAAQGFAARQMEKPKDRRVGTFVLSLEMTEEPSSTRLAQSVGGIDGGKLREGKNSEDELQTIITEWGKRKGIPLYFNFTSVVRASQLRAMVVEAIRRHNVGLVVVDHMRYFDMDDRYSKPEEEDEAKAKFLRTAIAQDLNVAVVLLAHTTKAVENTEDGRPRLSHLRGGGMVAAHADFVGFVYRPYDHAKRDDIESSRVKRTDAELIWAKNRHGLTGAARFYLDPSTMDIH